jgi:hypothetical protein
VSGGGGGGMRGAHHAHPNHFPGSIAPGSGGGGDGAGAGVAARVGTTYPIPEGSCTTGASDSPLPGSDGRALDQQQRRPQLLHVAAAGVTAQPAEGDEDTGSSTPPAYGGGDAGGLAWGGVPPPVGGIGVGDLSDTAMSPLRSGGLATPDEDSSSAGVVGAAAR